MVLVRLPSFFVWNDPWFVQVASNFFRALVIVHRIHCSEKHGLPCSFETFSAWDQSTFWLLRTLRWKFSETWSPPESFTAPSDISLISDVEDVLCEVLRQQYIVLQCRIRRDCFLHVPELLWNTIVWKSECSSNIETSSCVLLVFPRAIELCLEFFIISSNLTAPSSSRRTDGSCRSNLIMAIDIAKALWSNRCVSMSIHFLSRIRIETRDTVTRALVVVCPSQQVSPLLLCPQKKQVSPSLLCAQRFQRQRFLTFRKRIYQFRSRFESKKSFCPETEIRAWFQYRNVFDASRPASRTGPIFVFPIIHPRGRDCGSVRSNVCSRQSPSSSNVMKNCPTSKILQPASQHSMDKIWSSRCCSTSNLCSSSCSKFPCDSVLVWGSATRSSVWISIDFESSFAASFTATSDSSDKSLHYCDTAPYILSGLLKKTVRRINSTVSYLPLCHILGSTSHSRFRTISSLIQVPRMTNARARICEHNSQL